MNDLLVFKKNMERHLSIYIEEYADRYDIHCNFSEETDRGALYQISFQSKRLKGCLNFWSSGWLASYLIERDSDHVILNLMLEPDDIQGKEALLDSLRNMV